MTQRFKTGLKRKSPNDIGNAAVPRKKPNQNSENVENSDKESNEDIHFACRGGEGMRNKIFDYITKCRRKEVEPVTIYWDRVLYLRKQVEDKNGFKQLLQSDPSDIVEVLGPCKKRAGKELS